MQFRNLKKGIASSPDLPAAHADFGTADAAVGRDEEAVAEINRALPMDRYGDLHYQLHLLYKNQGKTALAQEAPAELERLPNCRLSSAGSSERLTFRSLLHPPRER